MTTIHIAGNITADPEIRITPNGKTVLEFTIAENHRHTDRESGEVIEGETTYWRCEAWDDFAERIAMSATKGNRLMATGRIVTQRYADKDGNKRVRTLIKVTDVGLSLRWDTAKVDHWELSGPQHNEQ